VAVCDCIYIIVCCAAVVTSSDGLLISWTGREGRVCSTLPLDLTGSDGDEHLTHAMSREQTGSNVTLRTSGVAPCNL
jgi:hypothetical protein